jgi:hypothetical protein
MMGSSRLNMYIIVTSGLVCDGLVLQLVGVGLECAGARSVGGGLSSLLSCLGLALLNSRWGFWFSMWIGGSGGSGGGSIEMGVEMVGVVRPGIVSSMGDSLGGIPGGGAAAVVVAAAVTTAVAAAAPLDLLFNGLTASVMMSASACSSHSLSCSSLCILMGLVWDVCALLRMGGGG